MIQDKEEGLVFNNYVDVNQLWQNRTKLRELPDYSPQRRNVSKSTFSMSDRKICGADTETLGGKIWLFSTEFGVWEVDSLGKLIEVIFNKEHSYRYARNSKAKRKKSKKNHYHIATKEFFFWNLKFDANAIMKTWTDQDILKILETDELTLFIEAFGREMEVKIKYLEGKYMEIKPIDFKIDNYKLSPIKFWDISQFYNKMKFPHLKIFNL